MDVVEFIHAHHHGNMKYVAAFLRRHGKEGFMLVCISHRTGAENDLALRRESFDLVDILHAADNGLVYKHGNARFDKRQGKLDMAIPVAALDKRDINMLCHFGKVGITRLQPVFFDKFVYFLIRAEAVVVYCGRAFPIRVKI